MKDYNIDLTMTPPSHEPERQFYYMAKAREYVKKKTEEIGRPLTVFVKTFGCQMPLKTTNVQTA